MKKIALLAMLFVFSIVGVQSAQAAEEQTFDVKNRPQFERQQDFNRYEKGKLSYKEIEKRKKEMKKDHEKWDKQKKKDLEKNKKQWEKDRKKYGDKQRPNFEKRNGHNSHYGAPKHHKYNGKGKHHYDRKSPHKAGMHNKGYGPHKGNYSKPQPKTYPSAPKHHHR